MPTRSVSAFPSVKPRQLLHFHRSRPEKLGQGMTLLDSGSQAVYWALQGIRPSNHAPIWMPSLHCGVEVRAALDAGWEVRFYRVTDDLQVDEEDLWRKIERAPGPIYIIHYFGFPQTNLTRIAKGCRDASLPMIEDCAHSLFSKSGRLPLGWEAPLAVFSLGKTLGAIGGGALRADFKAFRDWVGEPFIAPPRFRSTVGPDLSILRKAAGQRIARVKKSLLWHRTPWAGTSSTGNEPPPGTGDSWNLCDEV